MCGIAGVFGHSQASPVVKTMLQSQQHRGQESVGIASSNNTGISYHRDMGMVAQVMHPDALMTLWGTHAIGHTRYSTAGGSTLDNCQPFILQGSKFGPIAVVHNGTLTNDVVLRAELEDSGIGFTSSSDTEVVLHLIAASHKTTLQEAIIEIAERIQGGFSIIIMSQNALYAVRDPHGIRPLVMGTTRALGALEQPIMLASETCAFSDIHAQFVRAIGPGEIVEITRNQVKTLKPAVSHTDRKACIFEIIYCSRPDAMLANECSVATKRMRMGRRLAEEQPAIADIIVPVPDSAKYAAIGYAQQSGIPLQNALFRDIHSTGGNMRSFLAASQDDREIMVPNKIKPISDLIRGQRIVMIDDSIVRGTVSPKTIEILRENGAREVHVRIASPPISWPCFYGIDTPDRSLLIAPGKTIEQIRIKIGADSLGYLSLEGLLQACGSNNFCHACFSGQYFVPPPPAFIRSLEKNGASVSLAAT